MASEDFWQALDTLVVESEIVVDRPRGSAHPRYPAFVYPLDYGYLQGTRSGDGAGIDIWRGTLETARVTAVIVAVDLQKRDSEIKLLLGCTAEECQALLRVHQQGMQAATLMERDLSYP